MAICARCVEHIGENMRFCPKCGYSEETPVESSIELPIKSVLKDRYVVGAVIGSGSFGMTYVAWDKVEQRKVAIKEYLPSEFATRFSGSEPVTVFKDEKKQKQFHDGLSKFLEEGEKLSKLPENDGIVKVYDSFSHNKTAYIVMEYLYGTTLAWILENQQGVFSPHQAITMLWPIIYSLKLAHGEGVIHGDISPENIFISNTGEIKLIDFAAARFATTSHSRSLTVVVKSGYSPEEQYRSTGDQGPYTDVYALGAVLYRMVKGVKPPDALERRMSIERRNKEIMAPLKGFTQANAIMNALNVRTQDRTLDTEAFAAELSASSPVKRKSNGLKRIDLGRLSKKAKAAILSCLVVICAVGTLFALGIIDFSKEIEIVPEGMTIVPSVVNQDYDRAVDLLTRNGLQFSVIGKEYSGNIPADYILYQDLTAGSIVNINTMVLLTISGGAEMRIVPYLSGENAEEAMEKLEDLGFVVRREARYSQVLRAGMVIDTSEEAGTELAVGSTIILYVSQGPSENLGAFMETVPPLIGLSWPQALEAAEKSRFFIDVIGREYHDSIPANHVISQSLEAGITHMNGEDNPILLVLSLGVRVSRVPDVRFNTIGDARAALEAEGLVVIIERENSSSVARDLVISQQPLPGAVLDYGSVVTIIVSAGEPPFDAPNVVGQSESDARNELTALGLTVTVSYEFSQSTRGQVLRQSVAPGTQVSRGDNIVITVSSGQDVVEVPNVIGSERSAAETTLRNAGFTISVNEVYSETVAAGRVSAQSPGAGTSHVRGSAIYITLSLGPEPIRVPDFRNMQQSTAESILRSIGLVPTSEAEFNSSYARGLVFAQSPAPDSLAMRGDGVHLTVSLGERITEVIDVTGLSRASAVAILQEQGYQVTVVEEHHARVAVGNVIRQNPMAGTTLSEGSRVTITVSLGVNMVRVPNVVNQLESAALAELAALGLQYSIWNDESSTVASGRVISTSPAAGSQVAEGSVVTVTVSLGRFVAVPNVSASGTTQASAESAIRNAGLVPNVRTEDSTTVPEGNVISQTPSAGTRVEDGSTVTITVSSGSYVEVPNVTGMTQTNAENALRNVGLVVGHAEAESETVPQGSVISQSHAFGTRLARGSTVTITISTGSYVYVPSVEGMAQVAAVTAIQNAGLTARITTTEHPSVPSGNVISQSPAYNARVQRGSEVSITVSSGPGNVIVPYVVGSSEISAKNTLESAGFVVFVNYDSSATVPSGDVISQLPSSGTSVPYGSNVTITVSTGHGDVAVPPVTGQSELTARSILEGAGFVVYVNTESSSTVPSGNVISQSPNAGIIVSHGSSVTITVSTGPGNVDVPYVIGLTQIEAEEEIRALELVVSVITETHPTIPAGEVIRQSPSGGMSVARGTTVTITVSSGPAPVTVPNVVGHEQEAAHTTLTGETYRFVVTRVFAQPTGSYRPGQVMSISPLQGTSVQPGSPVTITIAGVHLATDIWDLSAEAARDRITTISDVGHTIIVVIQVVYDEGVPEGQIMSISSNLGGLVARGGYAPIRSTLTITVSGPEPDIPPEVG